MSQIPINISSKFPPPFSDLSRRSTFSDPGYDIASLPEDQVNLEHIIMIVIMKHHCNLKMSLIRVALNQMYSKNWTDDYIVSVTRSHLKDHISPEPTRNDNPYKFLVEELVYKSRLFYWVQEQKEICHRAIFAVWPSRNDWKYDSRLDQQVEGHILSQDSSTAGPSRDRHPYLAPETPIDKAYQRLVKDGRTGFDAHPDQDRSSADNMKIAIARKEADDKKKGKGKDV